MSDNLRKKFMDLEYASKIESPIRRKKFLKLIASDPEVYRALREIVINIIKENIVVDNKAKKKLSKDKKTIYEIYNNSKICAKKRKDLVIQSGGWIWILELVKEAIESLI